jgi:hypothetical protein
MFKRRKELLNKCEILDSEVNSLKLRIKDLADDRRGFYTAIDEIHSIITDVIVNGPRARTKK